MIQRVAYERGSFFLPGAWSSMLLPLQALSSRSALWTAIAASAAFACPLRSQSTPPENPAATGSVRGSVRTAAGLPLSGAQLRLSTATGVRESDEQGEALLSRVPTGTAWLSVRRLGFRPDSQRVVVEKDRVSAVSVVLERVVVELAAVTVVGRREVNGPMAGFYSRQNSGSGRFFTGAEIDRRNPTALTDLFRTVPGMRIETRGFNTYVRVRGARCAPLVWLDGQPLYAGEFDLDALDPRSFEGIEVYSGAASVPVEYSGNQRMSSACGTILLWSKRGELRAKKRKSGELSPAAQIAKLIEALQVFTAADVDRVAVMDSAEIVRPVYPDSLFDAHASGRVVAEFVVSTVGEVNMDTFSAMITTHLSLVEPVRRALQQQRFAPALRGGRAVQQLVQQPFDFRPDSTARRRRAP